AARWAGRPLDLARPPLDRISHGCPAKMSGLLRFPGVLPALRASRPSLQLHHNQAAPQPRCRRQRTMRMIDSHFHWWPRSVQERLLRRTTFPHAEAISKGGYSVQREQHADYTLSSWTEWYDLDKQLEHMDGLGHQVDVVCSIGPFSVFFSELPPEEGREAAIHWNEEMAGAQKKYPGRLWASAAVPLVDTRIAIEVLDDAVNRLGLMGVNLPGGMGAAAGIEAERLEPFYARCEELGLPLFLHPTDAVFVDMLEGYDGALHLSLGRVVEVSVAAMRLVLS